MVRPSALSTPVQSERECRRAFMSAPQLKVHSLGRRAREQRAAAAETRETAELQTNIVAPELGLLPAPDADGSADALDLAAVLRRVKDVVRVLENFRQLRDPARTRAEYMDQVGVRRPLWATSLV